MARSPSISADSRPSKGTVRVRESSSEAEEPIEDRPVKLPAPLQQGVGSRDARLAGTGENLGSAHSKVAVATLSNGIRRSSRSPVKETELGLPATPLFLDPRSTNQPINLSANGHHNGSPSLRKSGKAPSWSSINGSRPRGGVSSSTTPRMQSKHNEHDEEEEEQESIEHRTFAPGMNDSIKDAQKEAGPSMRRQRSRISNASSDPLALRDEKVDELEGLDPMEPIEVMGGSQSPSGSGSVFDPSLTKRKRIRSASTDYIDSAISRAAKGKGKAVDVPSSSRSNIVVEIPVLPLSTLKTYHIPPRYKKYRPDHISRLHLPQPGPVRAVKRSTASDNRGGRRKTFKERLKARQTLDPDGSFADILESDESVQWQGSDAEDGGDEDDDEDGYGDSESDPIALRRSRRAGYKPPEKKRPKIRATRAMDKLAGNHTFSRLTTSSVSEESFYGVSAPRSRLPKNIRPPTRGARRRAQVDSDSEDGTPCRRDDDDVDSEDGAPRKKTNGWAVESEGEEEMDVDLGSVYGTESDQLDETTEDVARDSGDEALRRHRAFCEKCARPPANEILARAIARKKKKTVKKRKRHEDEMSDEEWANQKEGWLECSKCVISSHWGCLAATQQKDVLLQLAEKEGPPKAGERRRKSVRIDERSEFVCARCTANPECFVCHQEHISANGPNVAEARHSQTPREGDGPGDRIDVDQEDSKPVVLPGAGESDSALLFRCHRCKLACHYIHLHDRPGSQLVVGSGLEKKAEWYQYTSQQWTCHQCRDWIWPVDIVCAWRPLPANAVEQQDEDAEPPSWKDPLPREYLVKWTSRGFRHVTWVPHAWVQATAPQKLRNFLEKGPSLDLITDETLEARGDDMAQPTIASVLAEDDTVQGHRASHSHQPGRTEWKGYGPPPDIDANSSIPQEWSTIDRVLDVMLLPPPKIKKKAKPTKGNRILSASASPAPESLSSAPVEANGAVVRPDGVEPLEDERVDIDTWEEKAGRILRPEDVDEVAAMVTWCFVKWDDLQYDQSTWDTPPSLDSTFYPAFKRGLKRYLGARLVEVPVLSTAQARQRDLAAQTMREPPERQPECIVGGTLMPFQMEGFQWLLYKHFKRESCILADDMGLGKTIQIASLLGYLGSSELQIYPCLVVVPNSTITNWVREFEKWVPHMRVVPYYGEASSRKIISKYELYRKGQQGKAAGLKAHVVLTTYDMITGGEFRVFGGVPRWEVLCVDEGQRLKSDNSLIFNRLKTLNSVHRILLTGTPLNNNLRELFNLLNFLDRDTFKDLSDLEARFEDLNEAKVTELHDMIKPYILRRIKADVLKLPPKIETIVPISLAPLQKNVYKTILERNANVLKAIAEAKQKRKKREIKAQKAEAKEDSAAPAPAAAEVDQGPSGQEDVEAAVKSVDNKQVRGDSPAQAGVEVAMDRADGEPAVRGEPIKGAEEAVVEHTNAAEVEEKEGADSSGPAAEQPSASEALEASEAIIAD